MNGQVPKRARRPRLPENILKFPQKECRPTFRDPSGKQHKEVTTAFFDLVQPLFEELDTDAFKCPTHVSCPLVPEIGDFYPSGIWHTVHLDNPALRKRVSKLFNLIQAAICQAHAHGAAEGKNLLIGLAKGKLTADQFNKLTVEPKKDDEE